VRLGRPTFNAESFSLVLIAAAIGGVVLFGKIVAGIVCGICFVVGILLLFVKQDPPSQPPQEHVHYWRPSIYRRDKP
jgi:hypothetical protein